MRRDSVKIGAGGELGWFPEGLDPAATGDPFAGLGCAKLDALAERLQDTPAFQATLPEPETLANELT